MALSDDLRETIKTSKLSMYGIAKQAGVATPVITRFVAGQRTITLETADKLAETLGLRLAKERKGR